MIDIPWLQTQFTSASPVSVMERLAAYASAEERGEGNFHFRGGPPAHAAMPRKHAISWGADSDDCDDAAVLRNNPLRGGAGAHPSLCGCILHARLLLLAILLCCHVCWESNCHCSMVFLACLPSLSCLPSVKLP